MNGEDSRRKKYFIFPRELLTRKAQTHFSITLCEGKDLRFLPPDILSLDRSAAISDFFQLFKIAKQACHCNKRTCCSKIINGTCLTTVLSHMTRYKRR